MNHDEQDLVEDGPSMADLHSILDGTFDAVFTFDADWRFTYLNAAGEELARKLGDYTRANLLGTVVWDEFPEVRGTRLYKECHRAMETGESTTIEEYFPPMESWFETRICPSDSGMTIFVRDTTIQKRHETELRQERNVKHQIVETSPIAIVGLDDEGRFRFGNTRATEILGMSEEQLTSLTYDNAGFDILDSSGAPLPDEKRPFRLVSENDEPMFDVELNLKRPDGERVWLSVNGTPLHTEARENVSSVFTFEDVTDRKRYEETLTALHQSSRELLAAETKADVSRIVIDASTDVLDLTGVVVYLFDDDENALRPHAYSPDVRSFIGDPPIYGSGTSITWQVFMDGETAVFDDVRDSPHVDNPNTAFRSGLYIPLGDHGVLVAMSTEVGVFGDDTIELVDLFAAAAETTLDRVERVNRLREHEAELTEQTVRLGRLHDINQTLRDVEHVLVLEDTREGIEREVCEQLGTTERFSFAWIGELSERGTMTPRTWAGTERGYLDTISTDASDGEVEPAIRTARTRTVTVVSNIADGLRDHPWRKEALSRGYQSAMSVPLVYDTLPYGVLTVYASKSDAFDELARTVFAELGETIAYAINAAETKQAQLTNNVIELDLRIGESTDVLHRVANDADCSVEFEGLVPSADTSRVFFTVDDADIDDVRATLDDYTAVTSVECITDRDGTVLFEATVSGSMFAQTLIEHGAVPQTIRSDPEGTRAMVDVPQTADVRAFIELLRTEYPDAELVARRDHERALATRKTFQLEFEHRLTDRQREVLRTAYLSGFFDSPRGRTGQEIGASLDISQPTFTHHLRAAQRKLLSLLYSRDTLEG